MSRAILYARCSPRPKEGESIDAQLDDMRRWCDENGYEHAVRLVYTDDNVSGSLPAHAREGLAAALAALEPGDLFVVRNLNRVARSGIHGLLIEEDVERAGARVCSLENGGVFATKKEDPNAWFLRAMQYLWAELERIVNNGRTQRKMRKYQREGRAMGSQPPLGYTIELRGTKGVLVPFEPEQIVLRRIHELTEAGLTVGEVTKMLNKHHRDIARGAKWYKETVRAALEREDISGEVPGEDERIKKPGEDQWSAPGSYWLL